LYLIDGGLRLDIVDSEDKDRVNIQMKKHDTWDTFDEALYSWAEIQDIVLPRILSPNRSNWLLVQGLDISWYSFADSQFTRRKMKFSWRDSSFGFRLYQMNNYRPSNSQYAQRPHTIKIDSWNIGFKPMRQSRQ